MTSVFGNVFRLSGGASVWANVFVLAHINPAIVTTRLSLIGTSRQRLGIEGTSGERLATFGTSQKRLTLEGASR